jgi:hypothetical protein
MYRTLIAFATCVPVLTPVFAHAEVLTTEIDGQTVTYNLTEPQRGAGLTREEILGRVSKSEPYKPVVSLPVGGSDTPVKR